MRVLVISDLHAPFHHGKALDFLRSLQREVRPHAVVCVGDEIDAHGWSRWESLPGVAGPEDELAAAKDALRPFFEAFPRVLVCRSNHAERHLRAAIRAKLPESFLKPLGAVLGAPRGWKWADSWTLDGVMYLHGEGFSGRNASLNAAMVNRTPTVIGHVHSWAGVQYHRSAGGTVWGMCVGCLVNPVSMAMAYAKHFPHQPMLGAGYVIDGVPHFQPLTS